MELRLTPPGLPDAAPPPRLVPCRGYYAALVIGCSAGGPDALRAILGGIPAGYSLPVLVVQHLHVSDDGRFAAHLADSLQLTVVEAEDKQKVEAGTVYVAPANYHLLVEWNGHLALSTDEKVNSSRPAIDVLFESAAGCWGDRLVCLVLSGANHDGAAGAARARQRGAVVIAQEPSTALVATMPQGVINRGVATYVLPPADIAGLLLQLETNRVLQGGMP
jgi:two-component system chemotaxis response regulator CheB